MVSFDMTDNNETLHPGRILLAQAMEPLGISRNQLARDIDVPVGRISDITNGKRGVTADTALRLGRYFGTGPELWLRLQAEFDLYVARRTAWPAVESRVRILTSEVPSKTPVKAPAVEAPAVVTPIAEAPVAIPQNLPATAPVQDVPANYEMGTAHEKSSPSVQEPLAEIFEEEEIVPSEASPSGEPLPLDTYEQAAMHDEPETPEMPPIGNDDPRDDLAESQNSVVAEPIGGDVDLGPGPDRGFSDDPEEELGIPPIPDNSKLFMSG
jgi:addiction module HigA family antidote